MRALIKVATPQDVLANVQEYISNKKDIALITKAMDFVVEKHDGQMRKSGDPYVSHLFSVGAILAQLRASPITVTSGILHDVIEDTDTSKAEVEKEFSKDIATIVESVSKIGNIQFKDEKEYLAENHRKIFIAMAKDIRVILVKLVDRLHNMRTLEFQPPEKQKKIARETVEVYAPIAHRLGISEIKNELEDLSFLYLHPENYYEIAQLVEMRKAERDAQVQNMIGDISGLLTEHELPHRIFGRSKHLYSIYKKMTVKNKRFDEILDLLAIRIITEEEVNCYEILGYIHAGYRPIPGRLKDYIAMPKMNMYQSLHTTILDEEGHIFEVQIRTEQMDDIAERGIAAHWRYKEGTKLTQARAQKEIEEKLAWFRDFNHLMSDLDDDDAQGYMDVLQKDIFEANVYVMTPKGRVIEFPNGATPIDFAYRIHTEVGHATIGALVNNVLVPLNTPLKTGDVVNIKTSKQPTGPSEDWLKIVKTNHARNKIRSFLQKKQEQEKRQYIIKGEQLFKDEVKRRELDVSELLSKQKMDPVLNAFRMKSVDDLYYAIATKSLSMSAIFERLVHKKSFLDALSLSKMFTRPEPKRTVSKSGISVSGVDTMMISLAGCCKPVYGDEIIGYITKGHGVKVHRKDCPNIIHETKRLIDVHWDEDFEGGKYEVQLYILANDRSFLLTDLVTVVSQLKANLNAVNSNVNDDKVTASTTMSVLVESAEHLRNLISNLKKVNSVISVERVTL